MVVICLPATLASGVAQERIGRPSRCTVQAPQSAMPQPNLVPVSPATSRSAQSSGMAGSASSVVGLPLSTNDVGMQRFSGRDASILRLPQRVPPAAWTCARDQRPRLDARLDIQIGDRQCIFFNELAARLDLISHARREDLIRGHRVLDAHLQQPARARIDGRLPELIGVHLTQTLVALDGLTLARLLEQPAHGLLERADVLAL